MTQVFDENGNHIPVTRFGHGPCLVVQRKTSENDGYDAVQLGFEDQKPARLNKPGTGHFKASGESPKKRLTEFRVDAENELKTGDTVGVDLFKEVGFVDVQAVSKGRGFQGVVKRWNMGGGRASHGSHNHRGLALLVSAPSPHGFSRVRKCPVTWEIEKFLFRI